MIAPAEHAVQVRTVGRRGTVTIDGHDVSGLTRVVDVSFTGGTLPVVTVGLLATEVGLDLQAADVELACETRDLLVRLGWTPPGGVEQIDDAQARGAAMAAFERMAAVFERHELDLDGVLRAWASQLGHSDAHHAWLEAARALLGASTSGAGR